MVHKRLEALFGDRFKTGQTLAKYTSARVGGLADLFVVAQSAHELQAAVELAYDEGLPYFILGGGSNILIADAGMQGLVVQNRTRKARFRNTGFSVVCTVESGTNLSSLARQCISKGLGGLEWAIGVPGTVGGAVFGNSGAHGADVSSNLLVATVWEPDTGLRTYTNAELGFEYRSTVLKRNQRHGGARRVILSAEFELRPEPVEVLMARADAFNTHRKQTQPAGATMGSMFKNPEHYYAGYLLESAGLKGYRIGGVQVSEKHANFFLNDENASAEDVRALLAETWNSVREQFGVEMQPEVELVGNWEFNVESERYHDEDKR